MDDGRALLRKPLLLLDSQQIRDPDNALGAAILEHDGDTASRFMVGKRVFESLALEEPAPEHQQ